MIGKRHGDGRALNRHSAAAQSDWALRSAAAPGAAEGTAAAGAACRLDESASSVVAEARTTAARKCLHLGRKACQRRLSWWTVAAGVASSAAVARKRHCCRPSAALASPGRLAWFAARSPMGRPSTLAAVPAERGEAGIPWTWSHSLAGLAWAATVA